MGKSAFEGTRGLFRLAIFLLGAMHCGPKRVDFQLRSPVVDALGVVTCSQDESGNLLLEIGNPWPGQTIATTTRVEFPGRPPFLLPTRSLEKNQTVQLQVPVPDGCQIQPCTVAVVLDHKGEVAEVDEANNRFEFSCRLAPFKLSGKRAASPGGVAGM